MSTQSIRMSALGGLSRDEADLIDAGLHLYSQEARIGRIFHHLDILKRTFEGKKDNRYLHPKDGRPSCLLVQCAEATRGDDSNATWDRIKISEHSSLINPASITTKSLNSGRYEPLPYKDWQHAYDSRNTAENPPDRQSRHENTDIDQFPIGKIERLIEPPILYDVETKQKINVSEWRKKHGKEAQLRYVFVSFTGQHFITDGDKYYLHLVGQNAARESGIEAYWLSLGGLGTTKEEKSENVWRICDIVRGSFQVVIAVADSPEDRVGEKQIPLASWGNRVWTLPELLLNPTSDQISVYTKPPKLSSRPPNHGGRRPLPTSDDVKPGSYITLREFSRFWDDAILIGQLIDHFEGSVKLGPLELMMIGLQSLQNRSTTQYLPGDLSYALMGFLRQRPVVHRDDSAFQAFARLSLANDSNLLLERLICLLPKSPRAEWHSMSDYWGVSLWDIYPRTQICGLGEDDTIILDGARAANIRWKSFPRVLLSKNDTFKRKLARLALTLYSAVTLLGIVVLATSGSTKTFGNAFGGSILGLALFVTFMSPFSIRWLYLGKVWFAQPWLIGFEGHMPLADIENHLFGVNLDRLSWSTTGSSLARHNFMKSDKYENYYEGQDPADDPDINERIQSVAGKGEDDEKIFTLVDTYTMTVTLFSALQPPVAAVMCGEEGGMQRALLCSWDWTNNTLYRETVLRMETRAY
ncbi:hypothetical protein ACLMJK_007592 [Lecanora helva]